MISLQRGVNLSHWLSQSERRGAERRAWTSRDDFSRIRSFGFDHVRLPVDEVQLWNEAGGKENEAWDLLEHALDWAEAEDLRMVGIGRHAFKFQGVNRGYLFVKGFPGIFIDKQLNASCAGNREVKTALGHNHIVLL